MTPTPDQRSVSYDDDIWRSKEDVYDPNAPPDPDASAYATKAYDGTPGIWGDPTDPQPIPPISLSNLRHHIYNHVTPVPDTKWNGWIEGQDVTGRKFGTKWMGQGWMAVPIAT